MSYAPCCGLAAYDTPLDVLEDPGDDVVLLDQVTHPASGEVVGDVEVRTTYDGGGGSATTTATEPDDEPADEPLQGGDGGVILYATDDPADTGPYVATTTDPATGEVVSGPQVRETFTAPTPYDLVDTEAGFGIVGWLLGFVVASALAGRG